MTVERFHTICIVVSECAGSYAVISISQSVQAVCFCRHPPSSWECKRKVILPHFCG